MANAVSSRSHAVLQLSVKYRGPADAAPAPADADAEDGAAAAAPPPPPIVEREAMVSLVDLAGSERASQTENRGARLHEGAKVRRAVAALATPHPSPPRPPRSTCLS
jgi:kinesin family protein 18/19